MHSSLVALTGALYRHIARPILFRVDPEKAHARAVALGERLGWSRAARDVMYAAFRVDDRSLRQEVADIDFPNPIGLAAGFDYEGRLTQALPCIGLGFGTVGTLTHRAYGGNPGPMLGRLPRSRSLMVNKGFKNLGVAATLARLNGLTFAYPVGVSIGKTNAADITTQKDAVRDVVRGFEDAEASGVPFAYYELNVSCPNLAGHVEFYDPRHLRDLLKALIPLRLNRPVFVKMPIAKTDDEVRAMMDVVVRFPYAKAVIIGNLQQDRAHPELVPKEVARFPRGNFSGLPCRARSDELIGLVYREHGRDIRIIGCGGIFSAEDAYRKIRLGASLVQLITGFVYEGPQLAAQMNRGIARLLERDGFRSVGDAVGAEAKTSSTLNAGSVVTPAEP